MARFYDQLAPDVMLVVSFSSKLWAGEQAPAQLQWSDWEKVAAAQHSGDKRPFCAGPTNGMTTFSNCRTRRTDTK